MRITRSDACDRHYNNVRPDKCPDSDNRRISIARRPSVLSSRSRARMNNLLVAIALLSTANPAMLRPLVPDPYDSYAKSFHSVVEQVKRYMAWH